MQRDFIDETKWTGEKDFLKRRELREAEIDRYYNSYPQVPHGGKRSYADWLLERTNAGLPTNVDPPSDVETCEDWRTRTIGVPTHPGSPTLGVSTTVSRTVTVNRDIGRTPRFSFLKFLYPRPEVSDDPFADRPVIPGPERLERLKAMRAMIESDTGSSAHSRPAPVVAGPERLARLSAMRDMQQAGGSGAARPELSLSHRAQLFLYNLVR